MGVIDKEECGGGGGGRGVGGGGRGGEDSWRDWLMLPCQSLVAGLVGAGLPAGSCREGRGLCVYR